MVRLPKLFSLSLALVLAPLALRGQATWSLTRHGTYFIAVGEETIPGAPAVSANMVHILVGVDPRSQNLAFISFQIPKVSDKKAGLTVSFATEERNGSTKLLKSARLDFDTCGPADCQVTIPHPKETQLTLEQFQELALKGDRLTLGFMHDGRMVSLSLELKPLRDHLASLQARAGSLLGTGY